MILKGLNIHEAAIEAAGAQSRLDEARRHYYLTGLGAADLDRLALSARDAYRRLVAAQAQQSKSNTIR
jgi:hypothetical protein